MLFSLAFETAPCFLLLRGYGIRPYVYPIHSCRVRYCPLIFSYSQTKLKSVALADLDDLTPVTL